MNGSIFNYSVIRPFSYFGLSSVLWDVHFYTILQTWIMFGVLILFIGCIRLMLRSKKAVLAHQAMLIITNFFVDLIEETCGTFKEDIFYFVLTIFIFIVGAGITGLIPYVGESTQDLNTTFALGLSSFCFAQYQGIKAHGLSHFKEYLQPFFILLPLNIVGECAKAASMSFRLFGNILGGSIMVDLILHALGAAKELYISMAFFLLVYSFLVYKTPLTRFSGLKTMHTMLFYIIIAVPTIQLFFGVVESLVQGFVLTTLTITYSAMAIGDVEEHEGPDAIQKEHV